MEKFLSVVGVLSGQLAEGCEYLHLNAVYNAFQQKEVFT